MSAVPDGDELLDEFGITVNDLDADHPLAWVTQRAAAVGADDVFAAVEDVIERVRDAKVITGVVIDAVGSESSRGWMVWFFTTFGWRGEPLPLGAADHGRSWLLDHVDSLLGEADIIG